MISSAQCRAARSLLNWTQGDLAERVGLSAVSVRAFEKGGAIRDSNAAKIVEAFEVAGVVIIAPGDISQGGGGGVRFRDEPDAVA